jgi:hypothetical protein
MFFGKCLSLKDESFRAFFIFTPKREKGGKYDLYLKETKTYSAVYWLC